MAPTEDTIKVLEEEIDNFKVRVKQINAKVTEESQKNSMAGSSSRNPEPKQPRKQDEQPIDMRKTTLQIFRQNILAKINDHEDAKTQAKECAKKRSEEIVVLNSELRNYCNEVLKSYAEFLEKSRMDLAELEDLLNH